MRVVGVNDSSLGDSYAELIQENISKKKKDVLLLMEKNGDLGDNNLVLQTLRQKVQGAKIRVQLLEGEDEFATEKAVRDCILDEKQCPDVLVSLSLEGTAYAYQAVVDYSKVGTVKIIGAYENDEIRRGLGKKVIAASVAIDSEAIGKTAIRLQEYKKNGIVNEYQMIQQKRDKRWKMKRASISTKMIVLLIFTSVMTLLINVMMFLNINQVLVQIEQVYATNVQLNKMTEELDKVHSEMLEYLKTRDSGVLQEYYISQQNLSEQLAMVRKRRWTGRRVC